MMRASAAVVMVLGVWMAAPAPACAQALAIDSIDGPVTAHEIEAFKAFMQTRTLPPNSWGNGNEHNALADGPAGRDMEALGLMFEATHDVAILDRMIFLADGFVNMRNDLPGGAHLVMWTGKIEKVWVPNPPTSSQATYAGGENGDTIAHIAYCAVLILRTPSLWGKRVPDGDPRGYGATYLERARTYVKRCDEANDEYSAKVFVQPGTNLIRNPPNWPAGFHTMEAINIQMMLDGGYQRDAEAHELLGDDAARVTRYDTIVRTSVRECLNGMKHASTVNGHTVYRWYYYPWDPGPAHIESVGHAAYDVLGIARAVARGKYGIARSEVVPIADAVTDVISLGNGMFAGNVDGTGTPQSYLLGEWLPVGEWNDSAYALMANAAVSSGRAARSPHLTASVLWMKSGRSSAPDGGLAPPPDAAAPAAAADAAVAAADATATLRDAAAPADGSATTADSAGSRPAPRDAAPVPPAGGDESEPTPPATVRAGGGCACAAGGAAAAGAGAALPLLALAALRWAGRRSRRTRRESSRSCRRRR
jgi:hypothetical protein